MEYSEIYINAKPSKKNPNPAICGFLEYLYIPLVLRIFLSCPKLSLAPKLNQAIKRTIIPVTIKTTP